MIYPSQTTCQGFARAAAESEPNFNQAPEQAFIDLQRKLSTSQLQRMDKILDRYRPNDQLSRRRRLILAETICADAVVSSGCLGVIDWDCAVTWRCPFYCIYMFCCVNVADFAVWAEIESEARGREVPELSGNNAQVTVNRWDDHLTCFTSGFILRQWTSQRDRVHYECLETKSNLRYHS